jgi:hypothetical protein
MQKRASRKNDLGKTSKKRSLFLKDSRAKASECQAPKKDALALVSIPFHFLFERKYRTGPTNSWYLASSHLINYSRKPGKLMFFFTFFIIIHGIWITLSQSRSDQTQFNYSRKLTEPRSDSVHHECNSHEHYDSTVNKKMRLTRPSIHCEEKFPKNPVQSLSSFQFMLATLIIMRDYHGSDLGKH